MEKLKCRNGRFYFQDLINLNDLNLQALSPQTEGFYYVVLPNSTLTNRRRLADIASNGITPNMVMGIVNVRPLKCGSVMHDSDISLTHPPPPFRDNQITH